MCGVFFLALLIANFYNQNVRYKKGDISMKKYVFLTSVLALAACGGGSVAPVNGAAEFARSGEVVSDVVKESNKGITDMASAVVVAKDGSGNAVVRSSKTFNGKEYEVYSLDDVKLRTAESLDGNTYLLFNLDEDTGEINAIKMYMGGQDSVYITRSVENEHYGNGFNGPIFEYVPDGDDRAAFRVVDTGQTMDDLDALAVANNLSGGHWNRVDEMMDFKTYSKEAGLQYADFGYFNPVYRSKNKELTAEVLNAVRSGRDAVIALERGDKDKMRTDEQFQAELDKQDYQLFAGGYAIKGTTLKDTLDAPKGTTFKGKAIGRVYTSIQGASEHRADHFAANGITNTGSENDGHDISKLYTTDDATLTVDATGKQTLVMPFNTKAVGDKYYDVKLVQNADGTVDAPKFTGTENDIGAQYRLYDALGNVVENESSLNMGYYGVNTATEAAGTARLYSEKPYDDGVRREYEVQAAWGLKKQ